MARRFKRRFKPKRYKMRRRKGIRSLRIGYRM